jgi:ribosome-associated protein
MKKVKKSMPSSEYLLVEVSQQPIELCKLLKIANLVSGGGEAKVVISEGYVFVNGETEFQKRKKIYHQDIIEFNGEVIQLMVNEDLNENDLAAQPTGDIGLTAIKDKSEAYARNTPQSKQKNMAKNSAKNDSKSHQQSKKSNKKQSSTKQSYTEQANHEQPITPPSQAIRRRKPISF